MNVNHLINNVEQFISQWRPSDVFRRTNWLYRVNALHPRDVREIDALIELVDLHQAHAEKFIVWGSCA